MCLGHAAERIAEKRNLEQGLFMGWLGKIVGGTIGFAMGGSVGAVAGAAFGHLFDNETEGRPKVGMDHDRISNDETAQMALFEKYYTRLGCSKDDSDDTIKKHYRKKVRDYHPDAVAAKGLPEELVTVAQDKFREIQEAYEMVKKQRGMS